MAQVIDGNPYQWESTFNRADGTKSVVRSTPFVEGNPNTEYSEFDVAGNCISVIYCPYVPKLHP